MAIKETYSEELNRAVRQKKRTQIDPDKRNKSIKRRKSKVYKYWIKVFREELGIIAQMSGSMSSFLTQIPLKNKKQLREWLQEHRIGGIMTMKNMGPAKLKMLHAAAESNAGVNKTKSEPLKEKPSVENLNYGQTIKLTQEQEKRFVGDAGGTRIKRGSFNSRRGKNYPTVVLYNDEGMILSFGKRKAQAILDVVNNPALLKMLEEFAGYSDKEVTLPYQSAQNGSARLESPPVVIRDREFDLLEEMVAHLGIQTEMGKEFIMVALECIELFEKKQRDYGSGNIAISGNAGLAVRLLDKACRLQHLIQQREKDGQSPENESIEDSFLDSANYGMIGILVTRGFWK